MEGMEVAVLVINYNGLVHLEKCFRSLTEQTYPCELYLVDNASIDSSIEHTRKNFPNVKIIAFPENLGFSRAYNEAVKQVDKEFIIFLNNDVRVERDFVERLVEVARLDEDIAAVGGKMLFWDFPEYINHGGGFFTLMSAGVDRDFMERDPLKRSPFETAFACGGAMLVRRDLFLKLGGFDEDFFMVKEDVDFGWRAWISGFRVMHAPASVIYHKYGASIGGSLSPASIFLGERNKNLIILKNTEPWLILLRLPLSVADDILRLKYLLRIRDVKGIRALIDSKIWIISNLRRILRARKRVVGLRKRGTMFLREKGLMLSVYESHLWHKRAEERGKLLGDLSLGRREGLISADRKGIKERI